MKILVTGAQGFIGKHLVKAFNLAGHRVLTLDKRGNLSTYNDDLSDPEVPLSNYLEGVDVVCHHAAQVDVRTSLEHPFYDAYNNILGSINLLEACVKAGVKRFIFASSGGAIGDKDAPESPYGIGKLAIEKYLNFYRDYHGLEVVILRYSNVYGPGQTLGVISKFALAAVGGSYISINGGDQTRDFVYIDDVVRANLVALKCNPGLYTISTGIGTSVKYIAERLATRYDIDVIYFPEIKGEILHSVLPPNGPADWQPTVNIDEGIDHVVASLYDNVR